MERLSPPAFGGHASSALSINCDGSPETLMRAAIECARKAEVYGDVPIGAVLWSRGKIIASAFNSRERARSALGHAELELIHRYNAMLGSWRLPPDAVIAVTAEPCLMCTGALLQARVTKLYYGCADTKNAGLRLVEEKISKGLFDHRFEIRPGILEKECASLLSDFFRKRRLEKVSE